MNELLNFRFQSHLQTPTQTLIPILLLKYYLNYRKAPATPHTTRTVAADRNGHPARVKPKGAAAEPKSSVKSNILIEHGLHG